MSIIIIRTSIPAKTHTTCTNISQANYIHFSHTTQREHIPFTSKES